jgi:ATP-dependent Clp endopeptidase proteolytic subunit ClpP
MNRQKLQAELFKPREWFRAQESGDTLELFIYDVVGPEWWEDGKRTIDLVRDIAKSKAKSITVRINSPGGSVFDGMAIYNALRGKGVPVTTVVDGMAASIASVIFAAGDTRRMATGSMCMVHNAWGVCIGDFNDMAKMGETLQKVNEQLVGIYARSGTGADDWREMMAKETYMDADEATHFGLATEKADEMKMAACAWGLDILAGVPDKFTRIMKAVQKRETERVLRDGGASATEAKRLAAGHRDDGEAQMIAEALKRNIGILQTK